MINGDDVIKLVKNVALSTNGHVASTNNNNSAFVNGRYNSKFLFNNITPVPYSKYIKKASEARCGRSFRAKVLKEVIF